MERKVGTMPRTRKTPNWKTAPALHELMTQVESLYEEAWNGEDIPGQEVTELVVRTMSTFVALGIHRPALMQAIDMAYPQSQSTLPPLLPHPVHEVTKAAQEPVVAEKKQGFFNR